MNKRVNLWFFFASVIFLLVACSEEATTYEAKASDFENGGFERNSQRIVVMDEELVIFAPYNNPQAKRKTVIDKILEADNAVAGEYYEKRYKNVTINTKKDMYYITADDNLS